MAVTHYFRIVARGNRTITTTLCGRMSAKSADGMNSTDDRAGVTCKFCLAALKREAR